MLLKRILKMPSNREKVESLIATGSEIAGNEAGGAIGFLAGGPGGGRSWRGISGYYF